MTKSPRVLTAVFASLLQNQDYRVQYDALQRVFVLPKPHSPHTLVVAALDPPIRKVRTSQTETQVKGFV